MRFEKNMPEENGEKVGIKAEKEVVGISLEEMQVAYKKLHGYQLRPETFGFNSLIELLSESYFVKAKSMTSFAFL